MKKLTSLIIIGVLLFTNAAFAQKKKLNKSDDIKVMWGPDFVLPKKHYSVAFVGEPDKGYVNICYRHKKSIVLQKFDPKLKLKGESTVELKGQKEIGMPSEIFKFGGNYYWAEEKWDKKEKKESLVLRTIDINTGKFQGQKKLFETNKVAGTLVMTGFYQFSTVGKFKPQFSADKNIVAFVYKKPKESVRDSKNFESFGFQVFDQSLTKLWNKEVRMPLPESELDAQDFTVTSTGDIYMLVRKKIDKNSSSKEKGSKDTDKGGKAKVKYTIELYKISKDEKQMQKIKIPLKDQYYYSSPFIFETTKKELCVVALYSSAKGNAYDGVAAMKLDLTTGKFNDGNEYEIPDALLKAYESNRDNKIKEAKNKIKGDSDSEAGFLEIRNAIVDEDGNLYITAEQYHLRVVTTSNGKYTTTTYYYYYEDIYAFKVNASEKLDWVKKIPKNQYGVNSTMTLSVKAFVHNGNYYAIYFDNAKNLNLKDDKRPEVHQAGRGGQLTYTKIDAEGNVFKDKLYNVADQERFLNVTDFDKVGDGIYLTTAYKRRDKNAVLLWATEKED
jgi:hypothetical protein